MLNKVNSRISGKTNLVRTLFYSFAVLTLAASFTLAQDSTKSKSSNHKHNMEMKMDKNMKMDMKGMNMDTSKKSEKGKGKMEENHSTPVAYKGVIDVKSIDGNKDGKVYQCPMDFNVLSDKPGKDPKCGMKLKEVSLEQAKKNLTKHGFEVK